MPNLKIYSIPKKLLWKSSQLVHMVVRELLRLSDDLVRQTFCWSDISKVHLKSNWTVGERLLASNQEAVIERRLNLNKGKGTFLGCVISKIIYLEKKFTDKVLSLYIGYSSNSSDSQMAWWTNPFVDWTLWCWCRSGQWMKECLPLTHHTLIMHANFT